MFVSLEVVVIKTFQNSRSFVKSCHLTVAITLGILALESWINVHRVGLKIALLFVGLTWNGLKVSGCIIGVNFHWNYTCHSVITFVH